MVLAAEILFLCIVPNFFTVCGVVGPEPRYASNMGVGRGGEQGEGQGPPWILNLLAKKGCFFNFEG